MKRVSRMNNKAARQFSTLCLSGALTLGAFGEAQAAGNDAALQALFAQANYWHEKSHDELAMESLQKVLSVDANNAQALYLMALWAQQGGNLQAAAQWRARLEKAAPNSPGLQDLDSAKKMAQVPQGQLNLARQQARSGNVPAALATWRSMFNGNVPPSGLAAEYYMTMASDKSLYSQAVSELRQYVAQHPQENGPRVALGKALTWREETRREGIAMLEPMASGSKEADAGLRQALLWMGPQPGDEPFYDTWIQRHPQDSEVQNYFRERRSGQARGQGYSDLNSGNTAAAKQQFEQVLQTNPQDADALAGMGYIAQRSGDFQAASQYLSRAADLGGESSETRRWRSRAGPRARRRNCSAPTFCGTTKICPRPNKRCGRCLTTSRKMAPPGRISITFCVNRIKPRKPRRCCERCRKACSKNCSRAWSPGRPETRCVGRRRSRPAAET